MIPNKRSIPVSFVENGTTDVKLPRNFVEKKGILSVAYTDTLSVAATSVRPRGAPIREIQVLLDGGKVAHAIKLQDAIRKQEVYEQTALSLINQPPSATTVGAKTGRVDVAIAFRQLFSDSDATALPAYAYDDVTLRIFWGGHAEIYVGGAGAVTVATNAATFTLDAMADIGQPAGGPLAFARRFDLSVDRWRDLVIGGFSTDNRIEVPLNANIRGIMLVAEDAVTSEPLPDVITAVTLLENNTVRVFNNVGFHALRADNATVFGVTMPPGCCVLEFAEDRDTAIDSIYRATEQTDVDLLVSVSASCRLRAHFITIERTPLAA